MKQSERIDGLNKYKTNINASANIFYAYIKGMSIRFQENKLETIHGKNIL